MASPGLDDDAYLVTAAFGLDINPASWNGADGDGQDAHQCLSRAAWLHGCVQRSRTRSVSHVGVQGLGQRIEDVQCHPNEFIDVGPRARKRALNPGQLHIPTGHGRA